MTRLPSPLHSPPALGLALVLALSGVSGPSVAALPASAETGAEARGGPPFRLTAPPSDLERARVEHWRETWREEAAALEESFEAALRAAETSDHRGLRPRCVALAGAVLELERPRVLPVPDRAADLHLRHALRHVTRAAVTCLTKRPYAARRALEQAAEAFAQARRVLRRYREPRTADPRALAPSLQD